MSQDRSNPHDSLARWMLNRPSNAAAIIRPQLPAELAAEVDWDQLELVPGTFVDPDLRNRMSDLLFRTRVKGRTAYIYCLLEHQSRADRFMAFRMLEYIVRIWSKYLADNREARKRRPTVPKVTSLPVVIPVVLHVNGTGTPWSKTAPTELADLYDLTPSTRAALGAHLPRLEFYLDDVAAQDLAQIRALATTPQVRLTLISLRAGPGNPDLGPTMLDMLEDLESLTRGPDPHGDLTALLTYLLTVSDTPESEFAKVFEKLGRYGKEALVSTADRIKERGKAEGITIGEARGIAVGEARGKALGKALGNVQGRAELLLNQMTAKFGALPTTAVEQVRSATSARIDTWATRILTATTLEEFLA